MLLSEKVLVNRRGNKKLNYYKSLGYDTLSDKFKVNVKDLTKSSKIKVLLKCDVCNNIVEKPYYLYLKNISKYNIFSCSRKCSTLKTKMTNLERYGVENVNQSEIIKEKKKRTNLEKWGVEFPSKSKKVKEKTISTNLERYGVKYYTQTKKYIERVKKTNLDKYNSEWSISSTKIREKTMKTNLEKYGVENPLLLKSIREKIKKTNLERYGVENPSQSEPIKLKKEMTNLEKRGVKYPMQDQSVKIKSKKTLLDRYNIDHNSKSDKFKKSVSIKNKENSKYRISKYKETNLENWNSEFVTTSEKYRKDNFLLSKNINYIKYLGSNVSLFKCDCDKNHKFEINSSNYFSRLYKSLPLCTICNPIGDSQSIKEKELFEYINSIYNGKIIQSYRDGLEIDIYLPELNIGFEFNGLYWHSEEFKDKKYHLDKKNYFTNKGIKIIHIWEDDWIDKRNILESQINNWLGLTETKIFARKCEVKEIKYSKISTKFLNENHIQGGDKSKIKIGLYYNNELVSLMTFNKSEGRKKMDDKDWNLSRFCNKINVSVVGGASKLLKNFIRMYGVIRVVSYADRDWSNGEIYEKLKFKKVYNTRVDYKYIVNGKRIHKSRYRKSNLETNLTESQYMKIMNIKKIWDCGKTKFEKII